MNRFILTGFLLLSTLMYSSCQSKDGDWEKMKWETDTQIKHGTIDIPADGDTCIFTCKNYNHFLLANISEDELSIDLENHPETSATGEWSDVNIEKNVMTVRIAPNTSEHERFLRIRVTAGDIFSGFTFKQKKHE